LPELCLSLVQEYGYWIFFLVLLAGTMGLPVPDEGIIIFAGVLVAGGNMFFFPALAVGIFAVLAGTLLNYLLAHYLGSRGLARWGKKICLTTSRLDRAASIVKRFGVLVPFCYFLPGIRMSVSYAAGILKLPLAGYMACSLIGASTWVGFYLWLGTRVVQ